MYLLVVLLLSATTVLAAPPFDGQVAKDYLDTLCCREFGGRKSGDPEMARCEGWAAANFAQFALDARGTEGYLQSFPILNNREEKATLELINGWHGRKRYQNGEDFHTITNSGSGKIQAEVVFCGYGIAEPNKGRDDFDGMDLKGKIALIYKAVPGSERIWKDQLPRDYKLKKAVEQGAAAVIFVHDAYAISGAAIHQEAFYPNVPVIIVSEHVADDILRGTGKRWDNVKKTLEKVPGSFATGRVVKIETRMKYNPKTEAANVIGVLPGSDSTLKNEWIVIGGHMDHNGVNAESDVFYGADDNASGAAIVMELARGFSSVFPTPKRSLMFIEFAAEEQGLLGSQWYVDHPIIPLEKVAAMINFDCCGMGSGGVGFGGAEHFPEIWEQYSAHMDSASKANLTVSTIWHGGSDNTPFQDVGIPTFNYWSRGDRPFYHHQEDLPQQIAATTLGNVGQEASRFIDYLANWEKPLITEYFKERTWLHSSFWIDLDMAPRPKIQDASRGVARMVKDRRLEGIKCQTVAIGSQNPYGDADYWRQFCQDNGFIWAIKSEDIRQAARKQKIALWPVITELPGLDTAGTQLRNLNQMGIKSVFLTNLGLDTAKTKDLIRQAVDEEMIFFCYQRDVDLIPDKCKKVILWYDMPGPIPALNKEELQSTRLVISCPTEYLKPDSTMTIEKNVVLAHKVRGREQILQNLAKLEQAGFSGQDIVYMLGENLLDILP